MLSLPPTRCRMSLVVGAADDRRTTVPGFTLPVFALPGFALPVFALPGFTLSLRRGVAE